MQVQRHVLGEVEVALFVLCKAIPEAYYKTCYKEKK